MHQLNDELRIIIGEFLKSKKFTKAEKRDLKEMNDAFDGFSSELDPQFFNGSAEQNENHRETFFKSLAPEVRENEQRSIREIYLRLARMYHPDKNKSENLINANHAIMQRINIAYKRGDIAELLSIEKKHSSIGGLFDDRQQSNVDNIDTEIGKLKKEIGLCKQQLARLRLEHKNLRDSDIGRQSRYFERDQRRGIDVFKEEEEEIKSTIKSLEDQIGIMRAFLNGEITKQQMYDKIFALNGEEEFVTMDDMIDFILNEESWFGEDEDGWLEDEIDTRSYNPKPKKGHKKKKRKQ